MDGEQERELGEATAGRRLEQAREERGLSLEEVERAIAIHAYHLKALERDDLDALPSPAFARGFSITYAKYLGLDEKALGLVDPEPKGLSLLRWKRYLSRHWRVIVSVLSVIGIATIIAVAALFEPYNPYAKQLTDLLDEAAPGMFLGSGPQRIVVVGFSEAENADADAVADAVVVAKVAEDGLGVLTIPENTLTEIPDGHGTGEIREAFALGGPDLSRRTAAQLTGTEVPHYLVIDPEGVRKIVESMGGVEIEVPGPVSGRAPPTGSKITLRPGPQKLDGDGVLVYLKGEDLRDDVERAERQRDFLHAMFRQALGPLNLLSNPTTLPTVLERTETNMGAVETVQLVGRVRALQDSDTPIETGTVPGRQETAHSEQEDRQIDYWVPDANELPNVLEETVQ